MKKKIRKNIAHLQKIVLLFICIYLMEACTQNKVDPQLQYSEKGLFGDNLLNKSVFPITGKNDGKIIYPSDEITYSFAASIPPDKSLKIVMRNLSTNLPTNGGSGGDPIEGFKQNRWGFIGFSGKGWAVSSYNFTSHTQEFNATGQVDADYAFIFSGEIGKGKAEIQIYENGSTEPTRTKTIQW